jgi:hypothetical protein
MTLSFCNQLLYVVIIHDKQILFLVVHNKTQPMTWTKAFLTQLMCWTIYVSGNTHPIRSTWSHFRFYVRANDVGELAFWYLFTCLFYIRVVCLFDYHFRLWYSAFSFKQKWRLLFNTLIGSETLLFKSLAEFYYALPKIEFVYRVWFQHIIVDYKMIIK